MNKTILTFGILFLPLISNGQDLIISVAPTINSALLYLPVEGGSSPSPNFGVNLSLDYVSTKEKRIVSGLGFGYQFSRVKFKPAFRPLTKLEPYLESANLIFLYYKSVLNLRNESFISLDPFIALHINSNTAGSIQNQTGLGISIGYGKSIPVNESLRIIIEPKLWVYNIIPLPYDDFIRNLTVLGLKAGICF